MALLLYSMILPLDLLDPVVYCRL